MLGYSEDELCKMTTVDTYPLDEMAVARRRLMEMRAMRAGKTMHFERQMRRKNGTLFPVEISVGALVDGNTHAIIRDITERKQMEKEREKLILELQEALANVKQLSRLLPICASCKKIRYDKGYWNQIEEYITEHTDTLFSHGMCPDCLEKARYEFEKLKKINKSE